MLTARTWSNTPNYNDFNNGCVDVWLTNELLSDRKCINFTFFISPGSVETQVR